MKRKVILLTIGCLIAIGIILFFNVKLGLSLLVIYGLIGICAGLLFILNKAYKKTNHWKNRFEFISNFISNNGYRDNISRNFSVVNLGSNPAKYGFFYENVRGQNWATGSQGFPMDFEILKYYHSYVRKGGYVLIPIMPFSAVSQFLETRREYWSDSYYLKFASILDPSQTRQMPNGKKLLKILKYPVLFNPKLIRFLLHDSEKDHSLLQTEQSMSALQLEQDARYKIKSWLIEFDANTLEDFYGEKYKKYYDAGVKLVEEMIDFCITRDLKPVLVTIPLSSYLANQFDEKFRRKMIDDFIAIANKSNVPVLNYMFDEKFSAPSFFNGSFYFNLKGRKIFTRHIMEELKIDE